MTYLEAIDLLYNSLPVFHHVGAAAYKAGPENILALEESAGNPHRRFASVHVAGTNGKGSVSHMLAAVLMATGYRTGLFTSPHLKDFRERIKVDGEMIREEQVVEYVSTHREDFEQIQPSFFEVATAMAFDHFARQEVDVAVIEVGMGGRLDATNIVRPLVSTITNISRDHAQFLGQTLSEIALEKAGIMKPGTPVVIGESQIETQLTFISQAKAQEAPILFADQLYRVVGREEQSGAQCFELESWLDAERFELRVDLLGEYQQKNILTVLATLDVLNGSGGLTLPRKAVELGLASAAATTGLNGRWQVLSRDPLVVCDTAHNEAGIASAMAQVARQRYQKLYIVLGFVADKELERLLPLLPAAAHYICTQAPGDRSLDADLLAQQLQAAGLQAEVLREVPGAVRRARELAGAEDMIYIGGSTFVVAEL